MTKHNEFIGSSNSDSAKRRPAESNNDLPREYGDTKVVALVRDPLWLHAYWEIGSGKIHDLKNMLGEQYDSSSYVLRVHDVSGIDFNGDNSTSYFDITLETDSRSWYINVGNPDREYIIELGMLTPEGQFILIARSNRVKTPRNSISNNIDEKWMMVEEAYSKILEMSGSGEVGKASADIMGQITKRIFHDMNMSSGTLSSMGSGAVAGKKESGEKDDFWFKVATELIIYGETQADAEVTVNGNRIELRPDGSFTLRYELPDGDHEFPIKAVSANKKHEKGADIKVGKETE
ncbi:MAG: DUF4912 domain-containing protein [Candidatus Muiribacteriaceae bacterium]